MEQIGDLFLSVEVIM